MDLTGHTLLGKYEIAGLIGRGGMGEVWGARHKLTGRKLAIKVLDKGYLGNDQVVQRFGREARAASTVQHPGIVEVLDLDQTEEGQPFLVMEFLEGETLARRIERRGRLDEEELVRLGGMLLEALDAAHSHGVIHRDLKPENIYVVPAGRQGEIVKILDFGISYIVDDGEHKLTMTGSVLGTPHYMSPEQAMGDTHVDHRADLYAVGVVLYECAVGDVPFDAPNYNKLLRIILDNEPPPPRSRGATISEGVEKVILWAMAKTRDRRIESARQMLELLQLAAAGGDIPYEGPLPSEEIEIPDEEEEWQVSETLSSLVTPGKSVSSRPPPSSPSAEVELDLLADHPSNRPPSAAPVPAEPAMPERTSLSSDRAAAFSSPQSLASSKPLTAGFSSAPPASTPGLGNGFSLGDPLSQPPPMSGSELELDARALRPSNAPPSSPGNRPRPAIGTASSSGGFPAARASSAGSAAAAGPVSGMHHVPPRVSRLSGPHGPVEIEPDPPSPWKKYLLSSVIAVALFVGVVTLINFVVDPGVDDATIHAPVPIAEPSRPTPPTRPATPNWVSIEVVGLPPGWAMQLDGIPTGERFRVRRGTPHSLHITSPGYADRTIDFEAEGHQTIRAEMRPADVEAP